ncbi:unnamed protein product [Prunus armeniaca]
MVPKVKGLPKAQSCISQGNGPRHEGGEGDTKLACLQDNVLRYGGVEGDTKVACRKAIWLGTRVPKATRDVARHGGT